MNGHLGILGGGQLGRMLALAAHRLDIEVRVLDPTADAPAGRVAPMRCASWTDRDALAWLADGAAAITWEREDVPAESLAWLAEHVPVRPDLSVLARLQDRDVQKREVIAAGIETARWVAYAPGEIPEELPAEVELPAMVKARRGGFDGRGQRIVRTLGELREACAELGRHGVIVEELVPFDDELAVLVVRGQEGDTRTWAPVLTRQIDGQLASAEVPHPAMHRVGAQAARIAETMVSALDHVGVLAVECFRVGDRLLVNELAPRVHNSGHWTPEGSACGQFEQHVRAVLGLPLGDCRLLGAAALANVVGELPERSALLDVPGAALTVYGKSPRPGRKLGHVSLVAADRDALRPGLERLAAAGLPVHSAAPLAAPAS